MKRPTKLAILLILLFFGLSLGYYYSWRGRGVSANDLRSLATWGLADFLDKTYPGSRVLILANPFSQVKGINDSVVDQEKSGIRGLKEGLGRSFEEIKVVYPSLKPGAVENPESFITNLDVTTPLSFLLTTNAFDDLAREHPDYDLWISLIGLPMELDKVGVWQQNGPPRFALLLPDLKLIGNKPLLRDLVMREKLVAFVITQPDVTFDTMKASGDMRKEFDRRYLLVTRENIDVVLDSHPGLFVPNP